MTPKEYNINTVKDMINCTNESNLDNMLKDLKGLIMAAHLIKSTSGNDFNLECDGFVWVDDNEHKINIELIVKDNHREGK